MQNRGDLPNIPRAPLVKLFPNNDLHLINTAIQSSESYYLKIGVIIVKSGAILDSSEIENSE